MTADQPVLRGKKSDSVIDSGTCTQFSNKELAACPAWDAGSFYKFQWGKQPKTSVPIRPKDIARFLSKISALAWHNHALAHNSNVVFLLTKSLAFHFTLLLSCRFLSSLNYIFEKAPVEIANFLIPMSLPQGPHRMDLFLGVLRNLTCLNPYSIEALT